MKKLWFLILIVWSAPVAAPAQFSRTGNIVEWQLIALQRRVQPLYRKPSKKELKAVAPTPALAEKYAALLRRPETGLVKLIKDKGCAENTKVVVATDDCLKYSMPGHGSSFSFRTESYRIPRLADLTFVDDSFQATGVLLHGIFVNIGDVPLDEVTPQTKGLKYLLDFAPEIDYEKAKELDRQLSEGVRHDGFIYRRALYTVADATFVLRSIAYDGRYWRAAAGITYNEFDYDKRRDVTVAFRIVEKDAEGNVTILWKKMQEKDAPSVRKTDERLPRAGS